MAVDQSSTGVLPAYNPTILTQYSQYETWRKIALARKLVAASLALLDSEACGTFSDPSDEEDRKDCAVNLLLQAFGVLVDTQEEVPDAA